MMNFFTPRSGTSKRTTKTQWVVLTAALLLALVVLPVSADSWEDEVEYTHAYESAANSVDASSARLAALGQLFYEAQRLDASSARLAALGQYYAAQRLEASHAASTGRYEALAGHFGQGDSVVVAQNAAELAANPELKSFSGSETAASDFLAGNPETKYASGWGSSSAEVADSGTGSENPELSAFQQYCSC